MVRRAAVRHGEAEKAAIGIGRGLESFARRFLFRDLFIDFFLGFPERRVRILDTL
ncbi:hypothetical protein D3C73_1490560 [compost metagenome]